MKKFVTALAALLTVGGAAAQKPTYTSQSNEQFAQTIAKKEVQLVDVRTPDEYAEGRLAGAANIDVRAADFAERAAAALDKTRPVAVYCRSGARSKTAAETLARQGYTVYELDRGISNWNGAVER